MNRDIGYFVQPENGILGQEMGPLEAAHLNLQSEPQPIRIGGVGNPQLSSVQGVVELPIVGVIHEEEGFLIRVLDATPEETVPLGLWTVPGERFVGPAIWPGVGQVTHRHTQLRLVDETRHRFETPEDPAAGAVGVPPRPVAGGDGMDGIAKSIDELDTHQRRNVADIVVAGALGPFTRDLVDIGDEAEIVENRGNLVAIMSALAAPGRVTFFKRIWILSDGQNGGQDKRSQEKKQAAASGRQWGVHRKETHVVGG